MNFKKSLKENALTESDLHMNFQKILKENDLQEKIIMRAMKST